MKMYEAMYGSACSEIEKIISIFCTRARSTEEVPNGGEVRDQQEEWDKDEETSEDGSSSSSSSSSSSGVPLGVVTRFGQDLEHQQLHERQLFCCHAIRELPPGCELRWFYSSHEFDAGGLVDGVSAPVSSNILEQRLCQAQE